MKARTFASVWAALVTASVAAAGAPPRFSIEATLPEALPVGEVLNLTVEITLEDGWSATQAGLPGLFLQFEEPASVRLEGRRLTSFRELARNEYLEAPLERMVETGVISVPLQLTGQSDGGPLGVTVTGYVQKEDGSDAWFLRRRVDLPVAAGSSASADAPSGDSAWGENGTLHIGDAAQPFTLPRKDATEASLADYVGKKNIIVTTYRAFW